MPILHSEEVRLEEADSNSKARCQVNVGTDAKPRTCGEPLKKINDWTWWCRRHEEVH